MANNIWEWNFVLTFLTIVTPLIFWIKYRQNFWKRQGIYQVKPEFFFGNVKGLFFHKKALGDTFLDIYKEIKSKDGKQGGFYVFLTPNYMPLDPAIIKQITVKDFNCFMNHGTYFDENYDPLSGSLFNLEGHKWRTLRANLTPTFTSGKIKNMYKIFLDCAENLRELLQKSSEVLEKRPIDIKDIMARFTIDVIGNCAFGVECNSISDPNSEFSLYGQKIFERDFRTSLSRFATNLLPKKVCSLLGVKVINPEAAKFFMNMVKETVEYREKTNFFRPDFMHLLLQLKNQGNVTDEKTILAQDGTQQKTLLNLNELAAQCFIFFFAGFETSATTMTFALFELAKNQQIQEKLRHEIRTVWELDDYRYEAIMKMGYLDKIICETLRKYPPIPCTNRIANSNYKIPNSNLTLKKGTNVLIPIIGLHMDPEYYPEPTKFDPERFSEEAKALRPGCTWIPFGEGPRACIGSRFGLLQSKLGVAIIIKNFHISLSESTQMPLEMDPGTFVYSSREKIWLNIEKV